MLIEVYTTTEWSRICMTCDHCLLAKDPPTRFVCVATGVENEPWLVLRSTPAYVTCTAYRRHAIDGVSAWTI